MRRRVRSKNPYIYKAKKKDMPIIQQVRGKAPVFGKNCFIAENAVIVGDVVMGEECSIWFNAVIRGDVHYIRMGDRVNVQDGAIIHCTYEKAPTEIGSNVSIAHNAIVHGCTLRDNVLVGMGSIIMDGCVVESNSIIAAGAVLTQGTRVEEGSVFAGMPARKIRDISPELKQGQIERIAASYVKYASWFKPGGEGGA